MDIELVGDGGLPSGMHLVRLKRACLATFSLLCLACGGTNVDADGGHPNAGDATVTDAGTLCDRSNDVVARIDEASWRELECLTYFAYQELTDNAPGQCDTWLPQCTRVRPGFECAVTQRDECEATEEKIVSCLEEHVGDLLSLREKLACDDPGTVWIEFLDAHYEEPSPESCYTVLRCVNARVPNVYWPEPGE